jgi:hypothetical protein
VTWMGLALAWAGPTAAPIAIVLIASAAAMTRVRVNGDCDDIFILLVGRVRKSSGPIELHNQGACQSRKTAKNEFKWTELAGFTNQELVAFPNTVAVTFRAIPALKHKSTKWSFDDDRQTLGCLGR